MVRLLELTEMEVYRKMALLLSCLLLMLRTGLGDEIGGVKLDPGINQRTSTSRLVPAWRITCNQKQPGVNTLFCVTLFRTVPAKQAVVKVCRGSNKTIFPQTNLTNSFLLTSLGTDLSIEVFILHCPCHRDQTPCLDLHPSKMKFTCNYIFTVDGKSDNFTLPANVSEGNGFGPTCCESDRCSNPESQKDITNGKLGQDKPPSSSRGDDDPHTGYIAGLCGLAVLLLVALALIVYLWRQLRQLRRPASSFQEWQAVNKELL